MGSRCGGGRKTERDLIPKPMTKRSVVMWPVSGEVSAGFGFEGRVSLMICPLALRRDWLA